MKQNKTKLIIFLILILSLFLTACSKEIDCSQKDTTYEKFTWDSELEKCTSQKIEKNVCGNGIIEGNENFCNCPNDVPQGHPEKGCSGTIGDYLEKSCNSKKECVLDANEKIIQQTKSVEFKNSDITINSKISYNQPYAFNTDKKNEIEIDMSLFKLREGVNVKNLIVKELRIEDTGSNLLASTTYTQGLEKIDDKLSNKKLELSQRNNYETKLNLRLKLEVTYTLEYLDRDGLVTKTENKVETLQGSLGNFHMINPNFYEEE
jgi:hypothetical protein